MMKYDYPVTGTIEMPDGTKFPILGVPMMSDERWQELSRENAVRNYRKRFGHEPENVEQAVQWQRAWSREIRAKYGDLDECEWRTAS